LCPWNAIQHINVFQEDINVRHVYVCKCVGVNRWGECCYQPCYTHTLACGHAAIIKALHAVNPRPKPSPAVCMGQSKM